MSYHFSLPQIDLWSVARTLVAATLLTSCSLGQAPCEPSHLPRPSARPTHASAAPAVDWTTMPAKYTHDNTGNRVDQYAQGVAPEACSQADFVRSGFNHTRSSLQVGFNSDHYHVTEQWGAQVRPYGEWRYPYRPFSVPYGAWGPQLPQVAVSGVGVYPWGAPGPWNQGNWNQGPWNQGPWNPGNGQNGGGGSGPGGMGPGGMGPGGMGPGGMGPGGAPPGYGYPQGVPWWGYPGVSPYAPYGGVGPFGVGPGNAMSPIQEDYYPQAPIYQQPSDGYFHSPYRNGP